MKLKEINSSRRRFFKTSSFLLGAAFLPNELLNLSKATIGSSISIPVTYKGKSLGIKFTLINGDYVIGTLRVPNGKKVGHFYISGPTKTTEAKDASFTFKLASDSRAKVSVNTSKAIITTSVKGIKIGVPKFNDSQHDNIPSSQGFFNWLADRVRDVAAGIAVGIGYLTGDQVSAKTSSGGVIHTHVDSNGSTVSYNNGSGFMAEPGLEEQPGVWY